MKPFTLTRSALADLRSIAMFTEGRWGRMDRKTIAIDLAKDVFELAIDNGGTVTRERLTRNRFLQYITHLAPAHIVMEACGSAHHWAVWHHAREFDGNWQAAACAA